MRRRRRGVAKGPTDLFEPPFVEPTVTDATINRPAIGLQLIPADMVMAAFVVKDEQAHALGVAPQEHRVDDEEALVWNRDAKVRKACVEHVAHAATSDHTAGDFQSAVSCIPHGWRGVDRLAGQHGTRNDASDDPPPAQRRNLNYFPRPKAGLGEWVAGIAAAQPEPLAGSIATSAGEKFLSA